MVDKKWTGAQQNAIEDAGGSLLVSAAAGSGKTAVLVERAVRLITQGENPISADRLLIVTFTNAAAEELRSRIGRRVEQELHKDPANQTLRRQRILLRRAAICTMDAFCQQLVKEHFARLSIPADVAVGDAALLGQLSEEALAETMEEMYESEDFCRFAALYGRARSDRPAQEAVLALYDFTRTLPAPQKQLQRFLKMYENPGPIASTPWGQELLQYAQNAGTAAVDVLQQAVEVAEGEEELAAYIPTLQQDIENAQTLLQLVKSQNWDACTTMVQNWGFGALKPVRGYVGQGKERVKNLRDRAKDIAAQLGKYCLVCTETQFMQDIKEGRPLVGALVQAVQRYENKYMAAKLAEKALDFSDFEHLALALLLDKEGRRTDVAGRVSARYEAVMVDEYQDTNELQSTLYECLGNAAGSNLFYVGDVKQSIYRFRKANPGIFLQKKRAWAPFGQGHPAVLALGHNFRSGQGVVEGVNYLFGALMSPELGEVAYDEGEKLIQGAEGGDPEGFELQVLEDPDGVGDAAWVAERIARMVAEWYPVRGEDGPRPCGYGDFCVLLRARARMREYVAALEAAGIPAVADASDDLLKTPEVMPVCAALATIDNPGDDVHLAATMMGPLFRFAPDEMVRLRAEAPRGSLWGALLQSSLPRAQSLVEAISFYRALAAEVSVAQLCEELVGRTGYLSAVAAMEGGAARRENLLRFIGWAGEVSAGGRGGLGGFVRFLQNGQGPAASAAAGAPGHVTVLTIHKSKGLEFPICFLADTTRAFNTQDLTARVQLHAQLGVGLALRSGDALFATLPALAVRRRAEREALSEEMRVLYVALTRAKEKLVFVLAHKKAAEYLAGKAAGLAGGLPAPHLLMRERNMAGWVATAALCHPDAGPLLHFCGGQKPKEQNTKSRMVMAVGKAVAPMRVGREAYRLTARPNQVLAQELAGAFGRRVAREPLQQVPVKVSVSALVKPGGEVLRKRPSFMYKSGLTAAEKGTAQHSFMQFANFAAAAANTEAEIERLVAEGFMEQSLAAKLDTKGIRAFLAAPLAGRFAAAQRVLREYDFITALPAGVVQPGLAPPHSEEPVMVQGIADAVLLTEQGAEIVDYKTDRGVTGEELVARYKAQLALYATAIARRLGVPVHKLTLWSFSLAQEVDVPLEVCAGVPTP